VPGVGASAAIWRPQLRAARKNWNVLVLDLRGHGRSAKSTEAEDYTFHSSAGDILDVLNAQGIKEAHFVGMSLGSVLVETVAVIEPRRVKSMVLAGGVAKLDSWAVLLMRFGLIVKRFLPYMWLYRLFAWIIMPGPTHLRTRRLFHKQAKQLQQAEFLRWYSLANEVQGVIRVNATRQWPIPTLYIMGDQDYMFRRHAQRRAYDRSDTEVVILQNAGHVCSVERADDFNLVALAFIQQAEGRSILTLKN
jgi:pimeloyl-ACP methyl ester carboxylesterase